MDDLAKMRAFVETVERGGFTAAARHADVAVSSIARQIRTLEDELGMRLINRSTRSQSLTEAGRLFYDRMRHLVREFDAVKRDVLAMGATVAGTLTVTIRNSASGVILPALPEFLEKFPDLLLDLCVTDDRLDLVSQGIDVAVWLGAMHDSSLVSRKLSPSRRVVCGSPAYFARHGEPQHPAELSNHNCLVFRASHYSNKWKFDRGDESVEVPVKGNLRSATGAVLLGSAMAGLGLALVQEFMARPALARGELKALFADYQISPTDGDTSLFLVYPSVRGMSPAARAFVDFLVERFRPDRAL